MPQLRDGTIVHDPRLDRILQFDERSLGFGIRGVLDPATQAQPVTRLWSVPAGSPVLDQGREGACVGFGVTNELRFDPVPVPGLDAVFAHDQIYWPAQRRDNQPGGSYPGASPVYEGTSVLAGVQQARSMGFYGQFRWAFGEADLALAVSHAGPAILGLNWWTGMFRPDTAGYLRRTGRVEGGHCILCIGINVEGGYYTVYNSWGPTWGAGGRAKIARNIMAALLADNGEACIPQQRYNPTR